MNVRATLSILALLLACPACGNLSDVPIFVEKMAYTPDGRLVVFTTTATKIYAGDLATETTSIPVEHEFEDWQADSLNLSANGQIASVSYGGQARTYGLPGGEPLGAVNAVEHSDSVQYSALSPDGALLFLYGGSSRDADGHSALFPGTMYRTSDGSPLWTVHPEFSRDAQYCAVWNTDSPPLFAPDGRTLYVPFTDRLFALDTLTGTAQVLLNAHACVNGMTFLTDGSLMIHRGYGAVSAVRLGNTPLPDQAQDESFAIYALDGTLIRELPPFAGYVTPGTWGPSQTPLACSPDGITCAMYAEHGTLDPEHFLERQGAFLLVFQLDGTLVFPIELETADVGNITFSPDGSRLAAAASHAARVYRVADGSLLRERTYAHGVF